MQSRQRDRRMGDAPSKKETDLESIRPTFCNFAKIIIIKKTSQIGKIFLSQEKYR